HAGYALFTYCPCAASIAQQPGARITMTRNSLKILWAVVTFTGTLAGWSAPVLADEQMWANSDRVNRRTCPSTECGVVGQLFFRESAVVLEKRNGWGRISQYY